MPSITRDEVAHLATLARLALTDEELDQYANECSAVFGAIEALRSVAIDDVPETCQVTGLEDVLRDDVAVPCDPAVRSALIGCFPERVGNLLRVKAVFADREV